MVRLPLSGFARRFRILIAPVAFGLLAACGGSKAPSDQPIVTSVTAGDGQVVAVFQQDPSLSYWLFGANSSSISIKDWFNLPHAVSVHPAYSPQILGGLLNTVGAYSFIMNSTSNGSPAGPASAVFTVTPRLAGGVWNDYSGQGGFSTADMKTLAFAPGTNWLPYQSGTYLAAGANGAIYTSNDLPYAAALRQAPTWTAQASTLSSNLNAAAWVGTAFVVAGDNGAIAYSLDAINWIQPTGVVFNLAGGGTVAQTNVTFRKLGYGNSSYFAAVSVATGGTPSAMVFTSPDLVTWTQQGAGVIPTSGNLNWAGTLPGVYAILGDNGALFTSPDLVNWSDYTVSGGANLRSGAGGVAANANGVTYSVVVGDGGAVYSTTDGTTWSRAASTPAGSTTLRSIAFGSRFMAVGDAGTVIFSDDGLTWSSPGTAPSGTLQATLFALGAYVAVGDGGKLVASY